VEHETKMYNLLRSDNILTKQQSELDDYGKRKQLLGLTYVSIGHRPTIQQYHSKQLRIMDGAYEITTISNNSNNNYDEAVETLSGILSSSDTSYSPLPTTTTETKAEF
jgi:hypothetical protein